MFPMHSPRNGMPSATGRQFAEVLGAAVLSVLLLLGSPANAEVIVINATTDTMKAGAILSDDARVQLPEGASATFVLPSGETRTISGPFDGRASELSRGVKVNKGLLGQIKRYIVMGGANERAYGGGRSAAAVRTSEPEPAFSWSAIPVTASGSVCLEKGSQITLVRASAAKAETVAIINARTKKRAELQFAAGAKTVDWPGNFAMRPDAKYILEGDGRPSREIYIRLISTLPKEQAMLQVLHRQHCRIQFKAWLSQLRAK